MKNVALTVLFILFIILPSSAQDAKFGKVDKKDLMEKYYPSDSSANAAVLYKKRRSYFRYTQGQGFELVTEIHERIKIYNKEGYDWATKKYHYTKMVTTKRFLSKPILLTW